MYFTPEVTRRVISRIASSLTRGGWLFMGEAETLRGVSSDFHLRHANDAFFYQLREDARPEEAIPEQRAPVPVPPAPPVNEAWIDTIRLASHRIAALRSPSRPSASAKAAVVPKAAATAAPRMDLAAALELLKEERFSDALRLLGAYPVEVESDRDVLLLRAVLLAQSGDPGGAERVCGRILELDELNAEAHYVKALCREYAGDRAAAADHDRYALYLDPTFAMPRLHLGLMAKRAGDADGERRELSRAVTLLTAEDPSRILLLGGGFARDALVELCRAELRTCGGAA
jgi:chemotaxis protein methyltransferase CheR